MRRYFCATPLGRYDRTMKLTAIIASLVCATFVSGSHRCDRVESAPHSVLGLNLATPGAHATGVRAEYATVQGRLANTVCHLTNTSLIESITLGHVVIASTSGVNSIITSYDGLLNRVVPPLGCVDLHIDNTIPGVTPTTVPGTGVSQVVFIWTGTEGLVKLTASIETSFSSNIYTRAEMIETGYDVKH